MTKRILACATAKSRYESPVGNLRLVFAADDLVGLYLPAQADTEQFDGLPAATTAVTEPMVTWLNAFFAGAANSMHDWQHSSQVRWRLIGTEFQQQVWQQLLSIPFGQLRTYRDIAKQVGRPQAVRAVGAAIGDNPLSILVPCHRVVGASGSLTGYAGGLDAKRWLLDHERSASPLAIVC